MITDIIEGIISDMDPVDGEDWFFKAVEPQEANEILDSIIPGIPVAILLRPINAKNTISENSAQVEKTFNLTMQIMKKSKVAEKQVERDPRLSEMYEAETELLNRIATHPLVEDITSSTSDEIYNEYDNFDGLELKFSIKFLPEAYC